MCISLLLRSEGGENKTHRDAGAQGDEAVLVYFSAEEGRRGREKMMMSRAEAVGAEGEHCGE